MGYLAKGHVKDACLDRIGLLPAGRVKRLEDHAGRTDRVLVHDIRQFNGLVYTPQGNAQPKHRVTPDDHGYMEEWSCTLYDARYPDSHHYVIKREVDFEQGSVEGYPCFPLCDAPPEQPLWTCLEIDCTDSCGGGGSGIGLVVTICCPGTEFGPLMDLEQDGDLEPSGAPAATAPRPMATYPAPPSREGATAGASQPATEVPKAGCTTCAEKARRRKAARLAKSALLTFSPVSVVLALSTFIPALASMMMPLFWGMLGAAIMAHVHGRGAAPEEDMGILVDTCEACTLTFPAIGSGCDLVTTDCCVRLPGDVIQTSTFGKLCFMVDGTPTCFAVPLLECGDATGTCDDPLRLENPGDCA